MEKKNKRIALRLDQRMYDDLRDIADYNGIPVSQLIRRMIDKSLKDMDVEEDLIYETISSV
jgi:predicted DNA-binding protein